MKDLLVRLTQAFGPSGNEREVAELIKQEIKEYIDKVYIDIFGNVIAHKKGKGKKIMFSAHMDQIGCMISHIEDSGFLRFTNVGALSPDQLCGARVIFENGMVGTIGASLDLIPNQIKFDNLFIDIGVNDKEEANKLVQVGDMCVFLAPTLVQNHRWVGGALDNRVSCLILLEVAKTVKNSPNDIYYVFSVQEEIGHRGAQVATYTIQPDMGIALDVTLTGDVPENMKLNMRLGEGVAIKVKDDFLMAHPKVKQFMIETAKRQNIPYQLEVIPFGGTDAGSIHISREGVPTGVVSIPCRYLHTPSEMLDIQDVEAAIALIKAMLEVDICEIV